MAVVSVVVTVFLALLGASQCQESLVDIAAVRVCDVADCTASNHNIDQLEVHAADLTQNTSSTHYQPLTYTSNYDLTRATLGMTSYDTCDTMGSQFLSDVVSSISKDLQTAAAYTDSIYTSCQEIYDKVPTAKDGYYSIKRSDGTITPVYCLMSTTECTGGGGWMRVASLDTTSSDNNECPSPLVARSYDELTQPLCQRDSYDAGCASMYFSPNGFSYTKVCGRARGYQYGSPDSFLSGKSVDEGYVDGLSITHGSNPRTHIWAFACGVFTEGTNHWDCPCNSFNNENPPPFVGDSYYCESGLDEGDDWNPVRLHWDDPLWDDMLCRSLEGGCCTAPSLPWFTKALGVTVTDDLEVRMCDDETEENERTPIDILELYVQ